MSRPFNIPSKQDAEAKALVLVAEASSIVRQLLERFLIAEGYRIVAFSDGMMLLGYLETARQRSDTLRPDVALIGVTLSHCTGFDALRAIRNNDWNTPVILISPVNHAGIRAEANRWGASVMETPVDWQDLSERIECLVSRAK